MKLRNQMLNERGQTQNMYELKCMNSFINSSETTPANYIYDIRMYSIIMAILKVESSMKRVLKFCILLFLYIIT